MVPKQHSQLPPRPTPEQARALAGRLWWQAQVHAQRGDAARAEGLLAARDTLLAQAGSA